MFRKVGQQLAGSLLTAGILWALWKFGPLLNQAELRPFQHAKQQQLAAVPALLPQEDTQSAEPIRPPAISDPQVEAATVLVPLSIAAVGADSTDLAITAIKSGDFTFKLVDATTPASPLLLMNSASGSVVVSGAGAKTGQKITLVAVDSKKVETPVGDVTPTADGAWTITTTIDLPSKNGTGNSLYAKSDGRSNSQNVEVASPTLDLPYAQFTRVFTHQHAVTAAEKNKDQYYEVYGPKPFIRLEGQDLAPGAKLQILVFDDAGNFITTFDTPNIARDPTIPQAWKVELNLPQRNEPKGKILLRTTSGGKHNYFLTPILVQTAPLTSADQPVIASIKFTPAGAAAATDGKRNGDNGPITVNGSSLTVTGTGKTDKVLLAAYIDASPNPIAVTGPDGQDPWSIPIGKLSDGRHVLSVSAEQGNVTLAKSAEIQIIVRSRGPRIIGVQPENFGTAPGQFELTVLFSPENPLDVSLHPASSSNYQLLASNGTGVFDRGTERKVSLPPDTDPKAATFDDRRNAVTLHFDPAVIQPDFYQLTVVASGIKDIYGNLLEGTPGKPGTDYVKTLGSLAAAAAAIEDLPPTETPGIHGATGPFVPFPEWTKPRPPVNGFNPSDHVETRVSRLYYYRDAHRVAQIVNRSVKSYNRAAVDMQRQLADKARTNADQATDARQARERKAEQAARLTRQAEHELQQAEANMRSAVDQAVRTTQDLNAKTQQFGPDPTADQQQELQRMQSVVASLQSVAGAARQRAQAAYDAVQQRRADEVAANEEAQVATAVEDRAREEQFRREVAAAHEDPDTYAPGKPDSIDPVQQVSVSVIGEGVIQLRGPMKGINEIRRMINQIDSPVGQVFVSVHTVQINGEHGDRMEQVAETIQKYIDQSRFLTSQTGEMLRKAITKVAALKAAETGILVGLTQEQRDCKYLYSFFGEDFIHELEAMDSEFLHTGNKLLSLHSMDSTSLPAALFIMALAKNSTRLAILAEFDAMLQAELPPIEHSYVAAGMTCNCKHKFLCSHHNEIQLLACNSRFESLRGFFDVDAGADDTITPLQREFIRLAQIFKSRLIVELQLNQRIMERAMIEERLGNYIEELRKAKQKENAADAAFAKARSAAASQRNKALQSVDQLRAELTAANGELQLQLKTIHPRDLVEGVIKSLVHTIPTTAEFEPLIVEEKDRDVQRLLSNACSDAFSVGRSLLQIQESMLQLVIDKGPPEFADDAREALRIVRQNTNDPTNPTVLTFEMDELQHWKIRVNGQGAINISPGLAAQYRQTLIADLADAGTLRNFLAAASKTAPHDDLARADTCLERVKQLIPNEEVANIVRLYAIRAIYDPIGRALSTKLAQLLDDLQRLADSLASPNKTTLDVYSSWKLVTRQLAKYLDAPEFEQTRSALSIANAGFINLIEAEAEADGKGKTAAEARHPLDHKKFLDMLIDEMEDKYIELLEGTRAHTANIDAYIKRLTTAVDDDFNNQYYRPAFRQVRTASRKWDVTLGQIETTSILANNRSFAKVTPQATMEFDLPKRDILIAEAMNGAKAAVQDFGALLQDPTFLALTQLKSGQSTSSQAGGANGGLATVRDVLPGLPTDTAEQVMAQHGPGQQKLGAALESLIPDPAVYKFETGTGYEIRPVIEPDGQAVVFHFNYMYTTNVREPVRPDEKHLGRVKRHFIDTDVQLGNYELREVSRYLVALKASRTSRGVPLLEDIPIAGVLFRPLPSAESSLQENIILAQSTIFPTLFDLMGLRWAPAVADLDPLRLENDEFLVRKRRQALMNRVYDYSSSQVDTFLRIPEAERRTDLYRSQETIPVTHPDGYRGPGLNLRDSQLQEGYDPTTTGSTPFVPSESKEGSRYKQRGGGPAFPPAEVPLEEGYAPGADTMEEIDVRPIEEAPVPQKELLQQRRPSPRRQQSGIPRSPGSRTTVQPGVQPLPPPVAPGRSREMEGPERSAPSPRKSGDRRQSSSYSRTSRQTIQWPPSAQHQIGSPPPDKAQTNQLNFIVKDSQPTSTNSREQRNPAAVAVHQRQMQRSEQNQPGGREILQAGFETDSSTPDSRPQSQSFRSPETDGQWNRNTRSGVMESMNR